MKTAAAIAFTGLALLAAPVFAHHAEPLYDEKNPITVTGVVARVEWSNPHAYLYLDVKNAEGGVEQWAVELRSPNSLKHNGWTSATLRVGDAVVCTGGRSRSGGKAMRAATIVMPDGRKLKS